MAQYQQPIPTAEDALRDAEKWNAGWDTFLKHQQAPRLKPPNLGGKTNNPK
jgi:hypothetical protein